MARMTPDGIFKVHFLTAVTLATPKITEIAAGVELTPFLAPAGLSLPDEGSEADVSDMSSERDVSAPSTISGNPEGEFWRDSATADDDAWTTLVRGATGYLVVALFGGTTATTYAIKSGDKVDIWPVRVSSRNLARVARGEAVRFTAMFALSDAPTYQATTIAGP
jgi:hypothetical protein